jgi:nucleotide-binding universal stress UspA family protein
VFDARVFDHLVVPVDLSAASFEAVRVAAGMAAAAGADVTVTTVVDQLDDLSEMSQALEAGLDRLGRLPLRPQVAVCAGRSAAGTIARRVESTPGATVALSAHGHGRSAAGFGTTTDELLSTMLAPLIVIGPQVHAGSVALRGPYVVPVDGSPDADAVLSIVAAWAGRFGATPWLVSVVDSHLCLAGDVTEASAVVGRAHELRRQINATVEYDVLHDRRTARAIADFAIRQNASLIFLTTHGRTGIERRRTGSVAAEVVRRADCPVVLFRPSTEPRNPWMRPERRFAGA